MGFRFFALEQAKRWALVGTVRNLPDGGVEVVAAGERESLEALLGRLNEGPPAARVAECTVSWFENHESFSEFTIRP